MHLDDIENLKNKATTILDETFKEKVRAFEGSNSSNAKKLFIPPALGIHPKGKQDYQFAVRVADESDKELVISLFKEISPEPIDVHTTGRIIPLSHSLSIGTAIARHKRWISKAAYGTLGCFVQKRGYSEELLILSNSHVIANLNGDEDNDPIITCNKGKAKDWLTRKIFSKFRSHPFSYFQINEVASFKESIPLKYGENINLVDAAIATVKEPRRIKVNEIEGLCSLTGFHEKDAFLKRDDLHELLLTKIGARTGLTSGRITSFGHKQTIYYSDRPCKFVELLEIKQPEGYKPFAKAGDSGAIVFDQNGYAVALVFSGTESQDGTTYAIPISTVLDALEVELVPLKKFQAV